MRFNYPFSLCVILFVVPFILNHLPHANATYKGLGGEGPVPVSDGPTVRKSERWPLVSSEFGEISAVKINDGNNGCYHLHFITMNPRSLFLPVYLHSQMLIYVKSGVGILSWINIENDDKLQQITLQKGDIYRLSPETVFYIQNNIHSYEYQPKQLQIHAIFPDSETKLQDETQFEGVYTGIQDLVLGFDNPVLQSALSVPEGVIEELRRGERQPLIVEGQSEGQSSIWDDVGSWDWGIRAFLGTKNDDIFSVRNKKKAYNIYKEGPDVKTQNGWSVAVTKKQLDVLKGTDFGVFMVNLTAGSMMGPHWNPKSVEIAIVLHGQGMIQVVCASMKSETGCKNMRFRVEEGDVFVVPRYHPMAQISFNNDSFVFMGFMLTLKHISPRYLSGKWSILKRLDRNVLQKSFNVKNSTIDWVLTAQREKLIYECISCAEEVAGESTEGGGGGGGGGGGQQEEEGGGGQQKEEGRGGRGWRQKEEEGGGRGGWQEEEKGGGRGGRQEEEEGGGGGWRLEEEEGGGGGVMEGDMGGEAAAKGNGVAGKGGGIHV